MATSPEQHGHSLKYGLMIGMFAATLLIVAVGLGLISQISAPLAGGPPATEEPDGSDNGSGDSGNPGDGAGEPGPGVNPDPPLPPGVVTGVLTTDLPLFAEPSVTSNPLAALLAGDTVTVVCTLLGDPVEYTDGTVSDAWLLVLAQQPQEDDDDDTTSPDPAPPVTPTGYVPALVVEGDVTEVEDC
jgi:hypothetical protein